MHIHFDMFLGIGQDALDMAGKEARSVHGTNNWFTLQKKKKQIKLWNWIGL